MPTLTTSKYDFRFAGYRLQASERQLAQLEVGPIVGESISSHSQGIMAMGPVPVDESRILDLTFFSTLHVHAGQQVRTLQPLQPRREVAATLSRTHRGEEPWLLSSMRLAKTSTRKETGYATHGLHPFKGKFYPQLVGGLLNAFGVRPSDTVLDPFVGSGTTLVECALRGVNSMGIDLHPLAAMISKAKVALLRADAKQLWRALTPLFDANSDRAMHFRLPNREYLQSWFTKPVLADIESLTSRILALKKVAARDLALVTLSSILRDVSLQEPKQLRVRRRDPSAQIPDVLPLFRRRLTENLSMIAFSQVFGGTSPTELPTTKTHVVHADARITAEHVRGLQEPRHRFVDAVITSPPYATALPYIDTDRLSLHLLGLLSTTERRDLDQAMIGNREIGPRMRTTLEDRLQEDGSLPLEIREFLHDLLWAVRHTDVGFRRQNMPALVYKYFLDMKQVLRELMTVLKPGGYMGIVVGNNFTTIGKRMFEIKTDEFLVSIGQDLGLNVSMIIDKRLTSAGLPDAIHSQNAMRDESILILRKPA